MNETLELSSLRWHALQRTLADAVGAETARPRRQRPVTQTARIATHLSGNWLSRARELAQTAMSPSPHY